VGRKAALLAWASAHRIPTPGGLVIPADRFWAALEACGAGGQARYLQQSALRLNPEQALAVAASIVDAMRAPALDALAGADAETAFCALSAPRLVCRSSSAMEDGTAAAFPGVFASVLDIGSLAELAGAIAACWRSAFTPDALGYILRMGAEPLDFSLALLVQRQVEAPWYGVYASADPVTGVAEPLADLSGDGPDALVGGARATLEARRRDGQWAGVAPELAASLEAVHGAAVLLAEHVESEVDVEFALLADGAGPIILQCRPLTSVGRAVPAEPSGDAPLAGRPCAGGQAAGVANAPGGVAVVERLTPADYGIVLAAAGVVTEEDASSLSHVAILCRELGVPLICGVDGARARLDGRWLAMDGGTGEIQTDQARRPPARERPPAPAEPAMSTVELLLRVLVDGRPGQAPLAEAKRITDQYATALGGGRTRLVASAGGHAGEERLDGLGAAVFGEGFSAAAFLATLDNR
jgi:pyruvate,water dikinase